LWLVAFVATLFSRYRILYGCWFPYRIYYSACTVMMRKSVGLLSQYLIGVLFGLGLLVSGMSNPEKILAFLDLGGAWDPSLIFVMGGAVLVGLLAFYLAKKRTQSFFGDALQIPTRRDIDQRLVIGSVLFGLGWGIAGFCPGPALVALGSGHTKALIFVLAMLVGMAACEWFFSGNKRTPALK
jgi:uncharacterized membrane protein YedE/YeeE